MGMEGSYKTYAAGRYQTTRQHVLEDSYSDDVPEHDTQVNKANVSSEHRQTIRSGFNLGVSNISLAA